MKPILLATDIPGMTQGVRRLLEEDGFSVQHVATGKDALACILEKPNAYALVYCKVLLPYLNGFELMQRLRQEPSTAHLPFVMLTYPPDEWDSFMKWKARKLRCYLSEDGRDAY